MEYMVGCGRRNCLVLLLLSIWCFYVVKTSATASIKGSIFTVKKADGSLVYSTKADYYYTQGMEEANKAHAER